MRLLRTALATLSVVVTGLVLCLPTRAVLPPGSAASTCLPPPAGPVGVSINGGARFTNDARVRVALVWPPCASSVLVANDRGLRHGTLRNLSAEITWTLARAGPERRPRSVYVRFNGSPPTVVDDIVLDRTPPRLTRAAMQPSARAHGQALAAAARRWTLRLRATDATSGVGRVQLARTKRHPWESRRYRSTLALSSALPRYARVRDRAGNWSPWRSVQRVKRSG